MRLSQVTLGFVRLPAPELLLFACPKRSSQEKRHPGGAPSGHPALQVRERITGFFDSASMHWRKTGRHRASHSASFPPPARRAPGAPLGGLLPALGSPLRGDKAVPRTVRLYAPTLAFVRRNSARRSALGFPGPLGGGEARTRRPRQGDSAGRRVLFAGAGAPSKSPAETHAPAGQHARRAPTRGVPLFGYFFSDKREKVTRAPLGARNPAVEPSECQPIVGMQFKVGKMPGDPS